MTHENDNFQKVFDCPHDPDPATVTYDPQHGRRATCLLCGASLVLTRRITPGGGTRPLTGKERREMKRREYQERGEA